MPKTENFFDQPLPSPGIIYKMLEAGSHGAHRKKALEDLWQLYFPYADPDFQKEAQIDTQFHRRMWEMMLACSLLQQGVKLEPKHSSKGPDLKAIRENQTIWIEAVAPSRGETVPELYFSENSAEHIQAVLEGRAKPLGELEPVPVDEIILQIRGNLANKHSQYQNRLNDGSVSSSDPYVIALNSGEVYPASGLDLPWIFKAVFSLGFPTVRLQKDGTRTDSWEYRPTIVKTNGSPVQKNFFNSSEYSGISGVIYSHDMFLEVDHYHLSDHMIFLHNPLAANPIPDGFFKYAEEWKVVDNRIRRIP